MADLSFATGLTLVIASPHLLPLDRAAPLTAAAVWVLALTVRALVAVGAAVFVLMYLPQTELFRATGHLCMHEVVPIIAVHLGLSGHAVGDAASLLPTFVLCASLLWLSVGLARGWLALRRQLDRVRGDGPLGSALVEDERILVAVTGIGRGRIVLSRTALGALDEQELRASLAHELAHLRRRHRPILLLASLLSALARPLPGTRASEREVTFSLERDADELAVRETRDPLALASAICKAAKSEALAGTTTLAGRGSVARRLEVLVGDAPVRRDPAVTRSARAVVAILAATAIALSMALPEWALASPRPDGDGFAGLACGR
jgi:Peptidase family M48